MGIEKFVMVYYNKNMKNIYDARLISGSDFFHIIDLAFEQTISYVKDNPANAKGAGSFCKYINYNGQTYAILSKRAQGLLKTVIQNIMPIINNRPSPVPILGGVFELESDDDYIIIMPKIEGENLPSYVYTLDKNNKLAKQTLDISVDAFNLLAEDSYYLNERAILIDFHGANFIYDKDNDKIRMLDLKKRTNYNEEKFCKNFMKLFAFNLLQCYKRDGVKEKLLETEGLDIDFITASNIVKAYSALNNAGLSERYTAPALRHLYGDKANIEDFEKLI